MPHGEETIDKLRLIRTPHIGPVSYRQPMTPFGSARAALDALPDLVKRGGGKQLKVASRESVETEMKAVAALGARYLFMDDANYPEWLLHIDNAPPVLTIKGRIELLDHRFGGYGGGT